MDPILSDAAVYAAACALPAQFAKPFVEISGAGGRYVYGDDVTVTFAATGCF